MFAGVLMAAVLLPVLELAVSLMTQSSLVVRLLGVALGHLLADHLCCLASILHNFPFFFIPLLDSSALKVSKTLNFN